MRPRAALKMVLDGGGGVLDRQIWVDSTTKPVNHKIFTRLIKNQPFIVIMPKSIFLQP
jgi:hypothetical protein